MTNPLDNPELYDVVVVAGRAAPGLAEVTGAGTPRGWDERKGLGLSGATLAQVGDGLPKFAINIYLWLPSHFTAWDAWKPLVARQARGTRYPVQDVYYPDLAELGISRMVVLDLKQREAVDDKGLYRYVIECQEWRKPLPVYSTPTGSKSSTQYARSDAADEEIGRLMKQIADLNK